MNDVIGLMQLVGVLFAVAASASAAEAKTGQAKANGEIDTQVKSAATTGGSGSRVGRHVAVTISRTTTYITEPLRADGYPDYQTALNRMASEGVTPDNNAAVAIVKLIPPTPKEAKYRETLFGLMGIRPPHEAGERFLEFSAYLKGSVKKEDEWPVYDQLDVAMKGPWSKKDCPWVARWLADNEMRWPPQSRPASGRDTISRLWSTIHRV